LVAERICPAILLQATAVAKPSTGQERRARHVTVLGVDGRFWPREILAGNPWLREPGNLSETGIWLNSTLADQLGVGVGDAVTLRLQQPGEVPRESLLGRRAAEDVVGELSLTVARILKDDEPGGSFSLTPGLEAPRNAFVPLDVLQGK